MIYDRSVVLCPHCQHELPLRALFIPEEQKTLDGQGGEIQVPVDLLANARIELRKAKGNSKATRQAALHYWRDGICGGFPSNLLLKWLLFWPNERESVFSQLSYSVREGREFIAMLKTLTVQEALGSDDGTQTAKPTSEEKTTASDEKAMTEARARIFWGESPSSVRDALISVGVAAAAVDANIKVFEAERRSEIRKIGIRNVAVGTAVLLSAGIIFYPCYRYLDAVTYTGGVRLIIAFAIAGLYGLWRLGKGLALLFRPRSEHRPISDI